MSNGEIALEVAESEFDRFTSLMDLDVDPKGWDAEDTKSFGDTKRRVLRAIVAGSLVIDDKGQPVFKPVSGGNPITFYEPTGATYIATDSRKKGEDAAKMMAVLADMTRENSARFGKMPARDLKVCQAIVALFLG